MLLCTKNQHAQALFKGTKTLEIRAGHRYRNVKAGTLLSINGHFKMLVHKAERYEDVYALLESLTGRFDQLGFASDSEMIDALIECYPDCSGPFFVWSVEPVSSTIKNPPSEQYSLAI